MHRIILWMRNDLRIHDNPVLHWATQQPNVTQVIPVYCFDPRFNEKQVAEYRIRKTGIWRSRFLIESVAQFRASLRALNSGLLVAHETPEAFLGRLAAMSEQSKKTPTAGKEV